LPFKQTHLNPPIPFKRDKPPMFTIHPLILAYTLASLDRTPLHWARAPWRTGIAQARLLMRVKEPKQHLPNTIVLHVARMRASGGC
jgi:hypothetical protein